MKTKTGIGITLFLLSATLAFFPVSKSTETPRNQQGRAVIQTWDANTEDDLAGYRVYVGEQSRIYGAPVDAGNVTEFVWHNLEPGKTYYFTTTAYDENGNESDYGNEAVLNLDVIDKPPMAPTNISVRIVEE